MGERYQVVLAGGECLQHFKVSIFIQEGACHLGAPPLGGEGCFAFSELLPVNPSTSVQVLQSSRDCSYCDAASPMPNPLHAVTPLAACRAGFKLTRQLSALAGARQWSRKPAFSSS